MSTLWLYTSIASGIATLVSLANYYTYSGSSLISHQKAKKLLKENKINHIIDIRTKMEFDAGHYPSAIHIPVTDISEETTKNLSKDSSILVYCNTGQRARFAANKLNKLGFKNVVYIPGTYKQIL